MTVTFGTPSAEQVTITAGIPLSSTGRISAGSRVSCIGLRILDGRHQPRSSARSRRLQVYLEPLECDGQARLVDVRLEHPFRRFGEDGTNGFYETLPNAADVLDILGLQWPVAQIAAFELIGFVRGELLDGESELTVVLERLEQTAGEVVGNEGGDRSSIGADTPP